MKTFKVKGLYFGNSVKCRNLYTDYDYLHSLSLEDLKWIHKFHREYYNADFKHDNPLFLDKQKIYNLNNSRNRCLYNYCSVRRILTYINSSKFNIITLFQKAKTLI